MYRSNFPVPPADTLESLGADFDPDATCLAFDTDDGQPHSSLSDPNKTPITIPIYIVAPFFQATLDQGKTAFRGRRDNVSENDTVASLLNGLFPSAAIGAGRSSAPFIRRAMHSAVRHDSSHETTVLAITHRGRFLVIPRQTTLKEIFAGARWPREGPLAFKDLREASRARDFEDDGVPLGGGWYMEIYVVLNDMLKPL
jgi:hypothetical protein